MIGQRFHCFMKYIITNRYNSMEGIGSSTHWLGTKLHETISTLVLLKQYDIFFVINGSLHSSRFFKVGSGSDIVITIIQYGQYTILPFI